MLLDFIYTFIHLYVACFEMRIKIMVWDWVNAENSLLKILLLMRKKLWKVGISFYLTFHLFQCILDVYNKKSYAWSMQ